LGSLISSNRRTNARMVWGLGDELKQRCVGSNHEKPGIFGEIDIWSRNDSTLNFGSLKIFSMSSVWWVFLWSERHFGWGHFPPGKAFSLTR
jgi:hypothetical protein